MIKRIKQFISACGAQLEPKEHHFLKTFLHPQELKLFYSMAIFDQRHALNVYYTAQKLIANYNVSYDTNLLYKACLLHDIGRTGAEISILGKVLPVIFPYPLTTKIPKWGKKNLVSSNPFKKLIAKIANYYYLYLYHPQQSAQLILTLAAHYPEDKDFYISLANIVAKHHLNLLNPTQELIILQTADGLN